MGELEAITLKEQEDEERRRKEQEEEERREQEQEEQRAREEEEERTRKQEQEEEERKRLEEEEEDLRKQREESLRQAISQPPQPPKEEIQCPIQIFVAVIVLAILVRMFFWYLFD